MLFEESQYYPIVHEDQYQNEFLFRVFQHIVLGGAMCQYDDNILEYLDITKRLYKDLITVAKDQDTGEIKVHSYVFQVKHIEGSSGLFPAAGHPQNFFYVIIDPLHWHCTLFYHKWTNFW